MKKSKKKSVKKKASSNLTLIFASVEQRANFIGWYLDGGGEQYANFYTNTQESDWDNIVDPYLILEYRPDEDYED